MTPRRLRPQYTDTELARIYSVPHQSRLWKVHQLRAMMTIQFARGLSGRVATAADLSCGDGVILSGIDADIKYYGDFAAGYLIEGPIEKTINQIPHVNVFICCETLEHVNNPASVLRSIRNKCDTLILSTPVCAWDDDNPEHYWAWGRHDVEQLLKKAGFTVTLFASLDARPANGYYWFGIWGAR